MQTYQAFFSQGFSYTKVISIGMESKVKIGFQSLFQKAVPTTRISLNSNNPTFNKRIELFQEKTNQSLLCCNLRGIERETLRVTDKGHISHQQHPVALGSTLTHPYITTDYSEALLEFITEPFPKIEKMLNQLEVTHQFTARNLPKNEYLWPSSMPCILRDDEDIPIAQYGSSNVGMMKTIYRRGLGHRYGRKMQTIAGVHFNFSVPDAVWSQMRADDDSNLALQDYRTSGYMGLVRNFRRRFWLLLYLMGASPVTDKSFVEGRKHDLDSLAEQDLYLPKATSLRMGDLGYQSTAQDDLYVCYNSADSYVESLRKALLQEYKPYEDLVADCDDSTQSQQLSSAVLQIENEFYSTIRPKQTARSGETQLKALKERGVEYIEVRCVDVNPYDPLGISAEQISFLELFLLGCLFDESPDTTEQEYREVLQNQRAVVRRGREEGLNLVRNNEDIAMQAWGSEIMQQLKPVADIMDGLCSENRYSKALNQMQALLDDPEKTPSAKLLSELETSNLGFVDWSLVQAKKHHLTLTENELTPCIRDRFEEMAQQSISNQKTIEDNEVESLCDYIESYFQQYRKL